MGRCLLLVFFATLLPIHGMDAEEKANMKNLVKEMFYHGYDSYIKYAFPHDELRPLSKTYTDSLAELGNAKPPKGSKYSGLALTLIDSLSTLAVLGNRTEFADRVNWLDQNLSLDVDVRVNLFELNIRVLGGLLSSHVLAKDSAEHVWPLPPYPAYNSGLLRLAEDLGRRMLPAFQKTQSAIPYAWINLKRGLQNKETREQCTAGVGTLILELGLLSYLTGNMEFWEAADDAMMHLWQFKSDLGLFGNTFNGRTGKWINRNAGIGAGVDSFYEYLLKAYIMFGNSKYLFMFEEAYAAVNKYLKIGDEWYVEGDMRTGQHSHLQFNSLQAFWPGLQVLAGDLDAAEKLHESFYEIWKKFGALPERFLFTTNQIHSTEAYYPLRPELIESTFYLYKATRDPKYLEAGKVMATSLLNLTRVPGGFASLRNVATKQKEDHMSSFFLAETLKYLYLMFDDDNFAQSDQFVFTTEGHLFPIRREFHLIFGDQSTYSSIPRSKHSMPVSNEQRRRAAFLSRASNCPASLVPPASPLLAEWELLSNEDRRPDVSHPVEKEAREAKRSEEASRDVCWRPDVLIDQKQFHVDVGEGFFSIRHTSGEVVSIRNLGSSSVEISNHVHQDGFCRLSTLTSTRVWSHAILIHGNDANGGRRKRGASEQAELESKPDWVDTAGSFFGPLSRAQLSKKTSGRQTVSPATTGAAENAQESSSGGSSLGGRIKMWNGVSVPCKDLDWETDLQRIFVDAGSSWQECSGELVAAEPLDACTPLVNSHQTLEKIVLVERGSCSFVEKATNAQNAGASALLVVDKSDSDDLFMMGSDGSGRKIRIPAMIAPKLPLTKLYDRLGLGDQLDSEEALPRSPEPVRIDLLVRQYPGLDIASISRQGSQESQRILKAKNERSLRPAIIGNATNFFILARGGWSLVVEKTGSTYLLKIL